MSRTPLLPMMAPQERPNGPYFSMKATTFAVGTVCLPLGAFLFCVIWSVLFNFTETTATHCGVPNYLPSISAAIGGVTPQRYIWRFFIGLQSAPRILAAVVYLNFYLASGVSYWWSHVNFLLNVCENFCLLLLTYVSSVENNDIHKLGFSFFMVFSLSYMIVTLQIWRTNKICSVSAEERRSYIYKLRLFFFNFVAFSLSIFFYIRHNIYCEPGVYTVFAFLEYLVVLSNMGFHMTAWFDFGSNDIQVRPPETKRV